MGGGASGAFCEARKVALSPNAVSGRHDQADNDIPGARVELVHKLTNGSGRITHACVDGLIADGKQEVEYVEVAGLVSAVIVVDTFHAALGLSLRELPLPVDGTPLYPSLNSSLYQPLNLSLKSSRILSRFSNLI